MGEGRVVGEMVVRDRWVSNRAMAVQGEEGMGCLGWRTSVTRARNTAGTMRGGGEAAGRAGRQHRTPAGRPGLEVED